MTREGLTVVWDGYWYVSGPPSQRHVVRETIGHWAREFPQDRMVVVVRRKHFDRARAEAPAGVSVVPSRLWPQALLASYGCRTAGIKFDADVVYTQNFAARAECQTSAVFIHDLLFEEHPEWFTRRERVYFGLMPRIAHHADVVLTSTDSESRRIARNSDVDADRVAVVGIGLSDELRTAEADSSPANARGIRPGRFLLSVGRLNVRKNLGALVRAADDARVISPTFPLVVIGAPNGRGMALDPRTEELVAEGSIVFTGHVSEGALRWFYENCRLFVFPSLGEGYGMPPVEAAYFGAPVLVTDLPVFRETLAGWPARFVDSTNHQEFRSALSEALESGPCAGTNGGAAMTWTQVVRATRDHLVARL